MTQVSVNAHSLADDLRALLERLDISATVTDPSGAVLASTHDAPRIGEVVAGDRARTASLRLCGHDFRVLARTDAATRTPRPLTARQRAVCELVAEGLKNREIADRLGISLHTVRRHVEALLARLQVETRQEAARVLRERIEQESASAEAGSGPRRVA